MTPALSQVCTLHAKFEQDLEDYAAGQCRAMEVWLTKLETYFESHSLDDVRGLLAKHEMAVPVASFQGRAIDLARGCAARALGSFRQAACAVPGVGDQDVGGRRRRERADRAAGF